MPRYNDNDIPNIMIVMLYTIMPRYSNKDHV